MERLEFGNSEESNSLNTDRKLKNGHLANEHVKDLDKSENSKRRNFEHCDHSSNELLEHLETNVDCLKKLISCTS